MCFLELTKVMVQEWQLCVLVSVLVVGVILIIKDMGALLICNLLQSQDANCEHASCYAHANLPRTIPKSYWSWLVAICEGSVPIYTMVSPNTVEVHVPRHLYACLVKTEVPD